MDSSGNSAAGGQILGKRKYGGHAVMRVANQSRNAGGSSSQVFHQKPLTTQFSIETPQVSSYVPPPPSNQNTPRSVKRARLGDHTFVMNTVATMKNGERPTLKRATTQSSFSDTSSINSDQQTKKEAKPTRLRPSRPVRLADKIYPDVWIRILSFCDPKFLLEARTFNKHYCGLLSKYNMIWTDSRLNHYGSDMPACPKGLTEKQYAELLVSRGCQNSKCSKKETQKVHWIFRLRLCTECLAENTLRVEDLPLQRQYSLGETGYEVAPGSGLSLWELLPLTCLDGRRDSHPVRIDEATNTWARRNVGNPRQFRFLKTSYAKLETEYQELRTANASEDAIKSWADKKHQEVMELMKEGVNLESWCKINIHEKQAKGAQDLRNERTEFFEARALEMSPPMERRVLHKMADFIKILKVRGTATDRSWETLKKKIEPYRPHAEQVLEFETLMESFLDPLPSVQLFKSLYEHRKGRKAPQRSLQPEQKFVLRLGQAQFAQCIEEKVADEDLLLLCLKRVFDTYSTIDVLPVGFNFDGTTGPYRLSLDDARMIVEDVLEKQIPRNSPRGRLVFQSLRCRGCRRNDHIRTYSFVEAFEHILQKHAREVGEGLEFHQFAKPYPRVYGSWATASEAGRNEFKFPWYTTFWPRTLPLVPRHQVPSEMKDWHPAVPVAFVQLEEPPEISAFEGRLPCRTDYADDAFALNLVHAAEVLHELKLDGPCQLKIALKFALDLYMKNHTTEPPISKFEACVEGIRVVNPKIDLKFCCGVCVSEEKNHRSARQSKYKKPVEALEKHWAQKHHGGPISWTEGMLHLPSEFEVLQQILDSDKKLQAEQAALREREATRHTDIKKRANAKANVVLQQRAAGDVFDELFPRES